MKITNFLYALLLLIAVQGYVQAQTKEISGVVRDASGSELLGVAVIVQGTHRGTQTDLKGHYKIKAQKGEVLEFSSMGLKTQTFKVGNSSQIDVVLVEDIQDLDEFVVVGYGSGRKISSVVGSVARVGEKGYCSTPIGKCSRCFTRKSSRLASVYQFRRTFRAFKNPLGWGRFFRRCYQLSTVCFGRNYSK